MGCEFPIYEVRKYVQKYEEGNYIILQTHKTRWVLDYKYKTDESYARRRIKLKTDPFCPYKIYPLYKMHRSIGQVINSKHRLFIDSTGRLITYKPAKFYRIETDKVRASWITLTGKRAFRVMSTSRTFIFEDFKYTHVSYIRVGKRIVLYDMLMTDNIQDYSAKRVKI